MVLINSIGFLLVLGGSLYYRYVFPKKKINLIALLFVISLLPLVSLLRIGDYESGDFNTHIFRTISFYQNLIDGNFLPSWAGMLNGTYGYPLFIFLNPLPYYLISLFHFLGFSFITSLKLFVGMTYLLSGIFMYCFTKETLKNDLAAFTSSIFYLFIPYHLVDLHYRIDVGEILCFVFIPLLLLFTNRLFKQRTLFYVLLTGLTFALLIMSHQAIALMSLGLILPFLITLFILNPKAIRQIGIWFKIAAAFGLGVLISSYVWLPYLTFAKYTLSSVLFKALASFVKVRELLYAPWRFGLLFQGPKGELSFLIGYTEIFIIGFCVFYLLFKKTKAKYAKELTVWIITTFFLIFMLTGFSQIVWLTVPVIKDMLMSSRILLVLAFSISFLAGYFTLINKNRKVLVWFVILLTIGTTILNWGQRRVIPEVTDANFFKGLPASTYYEEGLVFIGNTRWFSSKPAWFNKAPANKIETISGNAQVKITDLSSTKHYYSAYSTSGATLKENTLYFPGWNVTINHKQTKINFEDKKYPGLIIFDIPKGKTQISITYTDLLQLQILKFVFVLSFVAILIYTFFALYKPRSLTKVLKRFRK